ncbi:MAG: HEAT repeat domain-containing protein [Pirellulales bacterium]
MSSSPETEKASAGSPSSPDDLLPAVQPPSAGFLLQLFLIPLMIVGIIVLVWLLFSWLASAGSEPRDLVRDLKKLNNASWQKAVSLANQLQDPRYDHVKDDAALAQELADVLSSELAAGQTDPARLNLRIYLCRILGEFRVTNGLDPLLVAATQEKTPEEVTVRAAAVEALSLLINHVGAPKMRDSVPLRQALLTCSQASSAGDDGERHAELRSRAAFALGVLGGDEATERLAQLLADAYANTRYNAATGLARQGDRRAIPVLLEMLDPENADAVRLETKPSNREAKRLSVLVNGLRAAETLLLQTGEGEGDTELERVRTAIERLAQMTSPKAIGVVARDVLQTLGAARQPATPSKPAEASEPATSTEPAAAK